MKTQLSIERALRKLSHPGMSAEIAGVPVKRQALRFKINEDYSGSVVAPAHDTLVHEIVGWRISGVAG